MRANLSRGCSLSKLVHIFILGLSHVALDFEPKNRETIDVKVCPDLLDVCNEIDVRFGAPSARARRNTVLRIEAEDNSSRTPVQVTFEEKID